MHLTAYDKVTRERVDLFYEIDKDVCVLCLIISEFLLLLLLLVVALLLLDRRPWKDFHRLNIDNIR